MTISRSDTGHSRSARTQEETRELLQKELDGLTPGEREALEIAMAQVLSGTEIPELYETIDDLEWVQKPVPLDKFVNDPYYLGNTCDTLYVQLLEDLKELFKDGTYREAIFTGSIGWGKTFAASIGVCYMLHQLGCMRDPHRSFGIAANSNISVVCLSVNEVLATKVAYENIATKIEASPWFQEHFPFKKTKKELRFPRHIWVAARATTDSSVLGLNVIGGLLDETNFMAKSKGSDPRFNLDGQAQVLYNAMQRRMKSRFERKGQLPGMLFVVSSKQTADDFTAKRIRDSAGDPTIFVRDYSLWDVKPPEYYAGDWFHVIVGSDSTPSRMLKEDEDPEVARATLADGCILLPVPEEYRMDFERDLDGAVRDLAGVATVAVSPYINRRQKIEEAINYKRQHPFTSESWDPSQPGRFLWEKMVALRAERDFGDSFSTMNRPIINPSAARHIHIDPSLTGDCTGFAMGHVAGFTEVTRRGDDGGRFAERAPLLCLDVVLRIVPPLGDEIQLGDLRRLIYQLTEKGYVITRVTMDSWQSAEAIQKLNQKGYNAEVLSVDRTMSPYEVLKEALYDGRMELYDYPPLIRELRELEHDRIKRKVDHPARGSKDVADALAGICYSLTENSLNQPMPFVRSTPMYSGDSWMQEQIQHSMASAARRDMETSGEGAPDGGLLPAFLVGSGGGNNWEE
jgi:hypothetical protein